MKHSLLIYLKRLPEGYCVSTFKDVKYGISKQVFNNGKSFKLYAEALDGSDFISLNYYITSKKEILKPCEMPKEKVLKFLKEVKNISE